MSRVTFTYSSDADSDIRTLLAAMPAVRFEVKQRILRRPLFTIECPADLAAELRRRMDAIDDEYATQMRAW